MNSRPAEFTPGLKGSGRQGIQTDFNMKSSGNKKSDTYHSLGPYVVSQDLVLLCQKWGQEMLQGDVKALVSQLLLEDRWNLSYDHFIFIFISFSIF